MRGAFVSLRWLGALILVCLVGAYGVYLAIRPTSPMQWPSLHPDGAAVRALGGEVPSPPSPSQSSAQPQSTPSEWTAGVAASPSAQSDSSSSHPAVRRMDVEARMIGAFKAEQGAVPPGPRPMASQDFASTSSVMPFGRAPAESVPVVTGEPRTTFNPMQPNPALAAMTQQAQKDLTAVVEALKAVEGSGKP